MNNNTVSNNVIAWRSHGHQCVGIYIRKTLTVTNGLLTYFGAHLASHMFWSPPSYRRYVVVMTISRSHSSEGLMGLQHDLLLYLSKLVWVCGWYKLDQTSVWRKSKSDYSTKPNGMSWISPPSISWFYPSLVHLSCWPVGLFAFPPPCKSNFTQFLPLLPWSLLVYDTSVSTCTCIQ